MSSTIDKTLTHVLFLARHIKNIDLPVKIMLILMELRMPTNRIGFELLKSAIQLKCENPTRVLSADIYREIALQYSQISEEQVEQAIREEIKAAWKTGSEAAWSWYFSYDGVNPKRRPSNGEVISKLAYTTALWQGCEKEVDRDEERYQDILA